jgi:hypothetical protein
MKNDDYGFVDDLLKGLPKAPPRTKIEQRRMEKFIDEQISQLKAERAQTKTSIYLRFQTQFQLAAGFLVLVGGIAFAINFSSSNSTSNIAKPIPVTSPTNSGATPAPSQTSSNNEGQSNGTGNSGSEVFGNETNSPSSIPNILNTGFDYSTSLDQAKARITPKLAPISLGAMSAGDKNCVIKQGIDEVLAIDHAKYDGQKSVAFYYQNPSSNIEIKVVDSTCNLLIIFGKGN